MWHAPLKESDTARTHPQCLQRFDALQRQLSRNDKLVTDLRQGKTIEDFRFKSALEIVHSDYHFKKYGKALFRALVLSETYPDNMYLQAIIAKSLYQLFQAQKNHQLASVLELPDPRYEENYDRFLTFVHKLRLTEIAILAYQYIITRPENFYTDEEILHALWLCSKLSLSKVDPESVRLDYETLHPKGKYNKEMKQINNR